MLTQSFLGVHKCLTAMHQQFGQCSITFHCRGGAGVDRLDALTPLIAWVEKGQAPDRLVAARSEGGDITMTRPLCPYPQVARYLGGDPLLEASFECAPSVSGGASSNGEPE